MTSSLPAPTDASARDAIAHGSVVHGSVVLDAAWVSRWAALAAQAIAANENLLTELDRQIGDGDHGINMVRGWTAVADKLAQQASEPQTVGDVLKTIATTLMSTVGGAAGPLYGTAFLRASKVTARPVIDAHGLVSLIEAAQEGIETRGRASAGEKTMIDAWQPAAHAAETAATAHPAHALAVLQAAAAAADAGATATIGLLATKGRASYLGDRSIGHEDPGARSTAIILQAAVEAAAVADVEAASAAVVGVEAAGAEVAEETAA
ncbi:MAG: dihydroxyacetone kinase subunit L [Cellulomonadaceae bacterium]|jgi:dihydroxyacetone kinase-like protein|nr:dihydroxyacetone kinase subunit L [Cellulomonadaceae bacterium]